MGAPVCNVNTQRHRREDGIFEDSLGPVQQEGPVPTLKGEFGLEDATGSVRTLALTRMMYAVIATGHSGLCARA